MKLAIGSDHAGFEYKSFLAKKLVKFGYELTDKGTMSADSVDYPDYAHKVAEAVVDSKVDLGILLCGSGNGVCITANKHQHIRAALCWMPEIASLARKHNNANILCIPARFVSKQMAWKITIAFLESSFEGGRHQIRVGKIDL